MSDFTHDIVVEAAFGVEAGSDQTTWTWTTLVGPGADHVLVAPSFERLYGYRDEHRRAEAAEITLVITNQDGSLTPDDPRSPYFPDIVLNTPVRVSVDGEVWMVGETAVWNPLWPEGDLSDSVPPDGEARVMIVVAGVFRRLGQGQSLVESGPRSWIPTAVPQQPVLRAYWPLEDGSDAEFGAPVVGSAVMNFSGSAPEPGVELAPWLPAGVRTITPSTPLSRISGSIVMDQISASSLSWAVDFIVKVDDGEFQVTVSGDQGATGASERTDWVIATSGNDLQLFTESVGDGSSSSVLQASATVPRLFDGRSHAIRLLVGTADFAAVYLDGSLVFSVLTGLTAAEMQPASQFSAQSAVGGEHVWGHVAAWQSISASAPGVGFTVRAPDVRTAYLASLGFPGEQDPARILRIAGSINVPVEVIGVSTTTDDFERNEAGTWGTTPDGQDWAHRTDGTVNSVTISVTPGEAEVEIDAPGPFVPVVTSYLEGVDLFDIDIRMRFFLLDDSSAGRGVILRYGPEDNTGYEMTVTAIGNGPYTVFAVIRGRNEDPFSSLSSQTAFIVDTVNDRWWMRAQAAGPTLRLKLWPETEPEPTQWTLIGHHSEFTHGTFGAIFYGSTVNPETLQVSDFIADDISGQRMGPQEPDVALNSFEEASAVGFGLLAEQKTEIGILYRTGASLYDQDPAMVLDGRAANVGDIVPPFLPTLDDQSARNDITVRRIRGSSARAVDEADVRRRGSRTDTPVLNLASDEQLENQAQRRLFVGTWPGMRYPSLSPALDARPVLVPTFNAVRLGDRVDVINLPPQHPLGTVELLVLGYSEAVEPSSRQVEMVCVPYGPYVAGSRAEDPAAPGPADPQRRDTAGSVLTDPFVVGTDTELSVETVLGPLWAETGASNLHLPLDVRCRGAQLRVTDIDTTTPTVRDSTSTTGIGSAFSVDAPTLQEGDLLVLWHAADTSDTTQMGTPSGGEPWGLLAEGNRNGSSDGWRVWWKVAGDSEPASYGLTQDAGSDGVAAVVSVQDGLQAHARVATRTEDVSDTNIDTPSTYVPDGIGTILELRAVAVSDASGDTLSAPGGFTELEQANSDGFAAILVASRDVGGGNTGVETFTASGTVDRHGGFTLNVVGLQTMTVDLQPINGVVPFGGVIPAGEPVSLWQPAVRRL